MKNITYKTLSARIKAGTIELQSDIFGHSIRWASFVKISESGKRSKVFTIEVTGKPSPAERQFFNI